MGMTYMKNIKIKQEYGVDFGIIAKTIVQNITNKMADLAVTGMNNDDITLKLSEFSAKQISKAVEDIDPYKMIEIGKLILDDEEEYDVNKEEDMERIEYLVGEVIAYLSKKTEEAAYSYANLLMEKK